MIAFYAMIALISFPFYMPFYDASVFGKDFSVLKIVSILALVYAVYRNLTERVPLFNQPQEKCFLIYFLYGSISMIIIYDTSAHAIYMQQFALLLFFYCFIVIVRNIDIAYRVIWVIAISLGINCWEAYNQAQTYKGRFRCVGFFEDPNYFGSALLIGVGAMLAIMTFDKRRIAKAISAILLAVFIFTILKTMSRGVLVGTIFLLVIYAIQIRLYKITLKRNWVIVLAIILVSFVIIKKSGRELFFLKQRMEGTKIAHNEFERHGDVGSTSDRLTNILAGLKMIKENPIIGVGIKQYKNNMLDYVEGDTLLERSYIAHNTYIEVAAEQGLIIFLIFMAIIYFTLRDLQKIRYRFNSFPDSKPYIISFALQLGFIGYIISVFFLSAENEKLFLV